MNNLKKRINYYTNNVEEKSKLLAEYGVLKISEALYLRDNNMLLSDTICKNKNFKKFKQYTTGYGYCKNNCECMRENVKKTNIEKYGVEYISQSLHVKEKKKIKYNIKSKEEIESIKLKNSNSVKKAYKENYDAILKKRKTTNQEKYGVDHVFQNSEIKQKYKETCLNRYGVEWAAQAQESINSYKETCLNRYGVSNPNKLETVKEKKEQTNISKYGVPYLLQNDDFKTKIHKKATETFIKKYGVDHPWKSKEVRQKYTNTMIEKYEVKHPSLRHLPEEYKNLDYNKLRNFIDQNGYSMNSLLDYLGCCKSKLYQILNYYNLMPESRNLVENSMVLFVSSCGVYVDRNIRSIISPMELDIYIPIKKIAIELNGIYWHTESNGKNRNYHLNKTIKCEEQNIKLLHFWDNEWITKQPLCESIIQNNLGLTTKIPARKTTIKIIDKKQTKEFLNANHIQGYRFSHIDLGLFYQNKLISVMTFAKSRYNKKYEWEIIRLCNKIGLSIIGGPSKLFSYFVKNYHPNSVITYSERRLFTGKVYEKMGFNFSGYSKPNYFYTKDYIKLESRLKYQKHKLSNILDIFDPNLTEWENMQINGWDRIWDCGNSIWIWHN